MACASPTYRSLNFHPFWDRILFIWIEFASTNFHANFKLHDDGKYFCLNVKTQMKSHFMSYCNAELSLERQQSAIVARPNIYNNAKCYGCFCAYVLYYCVLCRITIAKCFKRKTIWDSQAKKKTIIWKQKPTTNTLFLSNPWASWMS